MRRTKFTLASLMLFSALGCRSDRTPVRALPTYTPEQALLLDDAFGPGVVDGDDAIEDTAIWRARVEAARAIAPALVATVSLDSMTGRAGELSISFEVTGAPLSGTLAQGSIEVEVPPGSPSYRLIRARRDAISGKRLLLFVAWFDDDGEPTPHWHAEPDQAATREAVARALARE